MIETNAFKINGFLMLIILAIPVFGLGIITLGVGAFAAGILLTTCFTVVGPNETKVITFFGKYKGVINQAGFWFTVPLSSKEKVSNRVINFNSPKLKVNDLDGNPIDIAAVIAYKVENSAKAVLDVEEYNKFVQIQSETSIRTIAGAYSYDSDVEDVISLRKNVEEVATRLKEDLSSRLAVAGVKVIDARIMHLAYAPEIAAAMLQRQQAQAIISARKVIVDGSVELVESAIKKMEKVGTITLTNEQKANMINNLLIAVVSDKGVQPTMQINND